MISEFSSQEVAACAPTGREGVVSISAGDVIQVRSDRLFGERTRHLGREFAERVIVIPEVRSIQVNFSRSVATIRFRRGQIGLAQLLEKAARVLNDNWVPRMAHSQRLFLDGSREGFQVFRYGVNVSSWRIVHVLSGRIRLRHVALVGRANLARFLERELNTLVGVSQAKASAVTGAVLIRYDPARMGRAELLRILERLLVQVGGDSPAVDLHSVPGTATRSKCDPIESAQAVAFVRAVGARQRDKHDRNPDYLAREFLNRRWRFLTRCPARLSRWYIELNHPGIYAWVNARTKHFDDLLLNSIYSGLEQFVILGSGYDSRPYRFDHQLASTRVFELDFPGTLARKKQKLRQLYGHLPDHVTYVSIDFNTQSIEEALTHAGYDRRATTFFGWEGVCYYLPRPAVENVLVFIRRFSGVGSSVAFDYATGSFVAGDLSAHGAHQLATWSQKVGEPYLFGLDRNEMADFLQRNGFVISSDFGPDELAVKYATRRQRRSGEFVNGVFRIVHAATR
jgi:methyltransferase (TIGR00027 family)